MGWMNDLHRSLGLYKNKILIGDTVAVINDGENYPTYSVMAQKMNLTNYVQHRPLDKSISYKVLDIKRHTIFKQYVLCGIESPSGEHFIVGKGGLKKL